VRKDEAKIHGYTDKEHNIAIVVCTNCAYSNLENHRSMEVPWRSLFQNVSKVYNNFFNMY
jgi:transcription elongation factor Elf1